MRTELDLGPRSLSLFERVNVFGMLFERPLVGLSKYDAEQWCITDFYSYTYSPCHCVDLDEDCSNPRDGRRLVECQEDDERE